MADKDRALEIARDRQWATPDFKMRPIGDIYADARQAIANKYNAFMEHPVVQAFGEEPLEMTKAMGETGWELAKMAPGAAKAAANYVYENPSKSAGHAVEFAAGMSPNPVAMFLWGPGGFLSPAEANAGEDEISDKRNQQHMMAQEAQMMREGYAGGYCGGGEVREAHADGRKAIAPLAKATESAMTKAAEKVLAEKAADRAARYVSDEIERDTNLGKFLQGTKTVNDEGDLFKLYHITKGDFSEFTPGGPNPELSGPGIWLSANPNHLPAAHNVGYSGEYASGTNVMPLWASMKSPLVVEKDFRDQSYGSGFPFAISPEGREKLISEGYDSVINRARLPGEEEYIVLHRNQLKSATGNNGNFDPNSPRIDENRGGEVREAHADGKKVLGPLAGAAEAAMTKAAEKVLAEKMAERAARYVADPEQRAENLARWKAGAPKEITDPVWYHGTTNDFDAFRPSGRTSSTFVTQRPNFANSFAMRQGVESEWNPAINQWVVREGSSAQPNIMPVHVRANNPFDYENKAHVDALTKNLAPALAEDPYLHNFIKDVPSGDWTAIESPRLQQAIRDLGHDSFFVQEGGAKNLALYEPDRQMKSATGNLGTFDPRSPRLDENRGGEVREAHSDGRKAVAPLAKAAEAAMTKAAEKVLARKAAGEAAEFIPHDDPLRAANLKAYRGNTPQEVVDQRWYHGTDKDFPEFNEGAPIFLTPSPRFANRFSIQNAPTGELAEGTGVNPNVMPLIPRAENPFDFENRKHAKALEAYLKPEMKNDAYLRYQFDSLKQGDWQEIESKKIQDAIKALGHDSFYVDEYGTKNLAVYSPNQVKSDIGNAGTFDFGTPRLTEAKGGKAR